MSSRDGRRGKCGLGRESARRRPVRAGRRGTSSVKPVELAVGLPITEGVLRQAGVIAYRVVEGRVQVLLVTSRETKRWIIPKGNIGAGLTPAEAAKKEAFEEAGVSGEIEGTAPLGTYTYQKLLPCGKERPAAVQVFLLRFVDQAKNWPERRQRQLAWMSTTDAIDIIQEPGVVPLLRSVVAAEAEFARLAAT